MEPSFDKVTYTSTIRKLEKLKLSYVEVPVNIIEKINGNFQKGKLNHRLVITLNNKIHWQCGITALGEGMGYISISAARMKIIGVHLGDDVSIQLEPDTSEYGFDVPVELEELLLQDTEGKKRFDRLKPGIQRYIIYYVIQVKSSQKRIERSILLIENLKRTVEGNETFRAILGKE